MILMSQMNNSNNYHNTGLAHSQQSCSMCFQTSDIEASHCDLCGSKLHLRIENSLQNTVALLMTSLLLYIPANIYPIMYTTYLGEKTENTIIGGVITLWEHASYPIALVIFIASILVPVVKIVALAWLCFSVKMNRIYFHENNHKMYRLTEFIGRWSMVDIFVVAILVALIQMGNIMSITPGVAAISFAVMVITTMLAAFYFEPRLIWANLDRADLIDTSNEKGYDTYVERK
jgi:paraquat-inducible protein A